MAAAHEDGTAILDFVISFGIEEDAFKNLVQSAIMGVREAMMREAEEKTKEMVEEAAREGRLADLLEEHGGTPIPVNIGDIVTNVGTHMFVFGWMIRDQYGKPT